MGDIAVPMNGGGDAADLQRHDVRNADWVNCHQAENYCKPSQFTGQSCVRKQ